MKRGYVGFAFGALVSIAALLSFPSCGHDQKAVSLQIQPASFTFGTPNGSEQFSAIATYIHPPATKDVTNQVTWHIDDGVVNITSAGVVTPALGYCGGGTVSATLPAGSGGASNVVVGYATVTVDDPSNPICPGGGTEGTLSVQITPAGLGTVTSLSGGISCPPGPCIAQFPAGQSVGLVATPASGHTFLSWTGCTTMSTNDCTVTVPSTGANVVATFQ